MVVQNLADWHFPLGDDCIAINAGSSNITISGVACGPGHGIRCVGFPFSFMLIKKRQKSISHRTFNFRFLLFFHGMMNFLSDHIGFSFSVCYCMQHWQSWKEWSF